MNINNGKTGNVNIPGALHSTGGDGDGQVGGVVAYAGDVYDETLGKNQKEINQTLLDGSGVIAVALNDLNDKIDNSTQSASNVSFDDSVAHLGTQENPITNVQAAINAAVTGFASLESNIPTKVSDLTNDSGYLTQHQTLPDIADDVTTSDATKVLSAKQGKLLNDRVTTLENAEITAEDVSYDSTETYISGTVGYAIKQLETASGGAGTSPSGVISQSPQSGTNLSPNRTNTLFDQSTNHDKLVPAEVSTSLGQNSACSGKDTYSTGVSSFASGDNVLAKGDNSAAFGEGSFAFGDGSVSVGVNDVMPCYIYVSEDSSYTGGSPRRYDVTIQPTKSLLNYNKEEVLDNMIIAIMPNHVNNIVDGIVYAQLFDVYFDIDAQHNRFGQYMNAKVYISDEDREVPYEHDGQLMTHTIGESEDAYYGLLCRSANGKSSATIGKNLMTSNEGEVAVGNFNVSHKKQTNLAGTIFSVGARGLVSKAERSNTDYDEWALNNNYDPRYDDDTTVANVNAFFNTADCSSPSNALEVLDDGKVFIRGIGGFNGLNSTTSGVKSVQEVIDSKLSLLDNKNNLIINPKSEVESTATDSLIGGIATVGKGAYTFGFGGNASKAYISGNASDGYQLQVTDTSSFDPTNYIRPIFENIYKDTYLLDANTYEKVAKITAVTPNTDGLKISITLDTNLGTLTNALYRLENISKNKSFNFGVFGNTGDWSSIIGYGSYNTGTYSNVIGSNNYNSKTYSTLIGTQNVNTGNYSTLIGYNNKVIAGNYPCAIGTENTLNAYGYAIGRKNVIGSNNKNGYLIGFDNYANTTSVAFLFGQKLVCENSRGGFFIGQYNKEYISNAAAIANWFAIGCGEESIRRNAIEVKQNADTYIYGVGGFTGGNSNETSVKSLQTVISDIQTSLSSSRYITYTTGKGYALSNSTTADGENSFAEGNQTVASGSYSHAEGSNSYAIGDTSHAEGNRMAYGSNSHAEGNKRMGSVLVTRAYTSGYTTLYVNAPVPYASNIEINSKTKVIVNSCVKESNSDEYRLTMSAKLPQDLSVGDKIYYNGIAYGDYSHVEGEGTHASAKAAHAEGRQTQATQYAAHAEGEYTQAKGWASHTEGRGTVTSNPCEHASGEYNLSTVGVTKASFGIGTSDNLRKNAYEIDTDGNVYIKGIGTYDGTNIGANGVKSVLEVIVELTQQIAALSNN